VASGDRAAAAAATRADGDAVGGSVLTLRTAGATDTPTAGALDKCILTVVAGATHGADENGDCIINALAPSYPTLAGTTLPLLPEPWVRTPSYPYEVARLKPLAAAYAAKLDANGRQSLSLVPGEALDPGGYAGGATGWGFSGRGGTPPLTGPPAARTRANADGSRGGR